MFLSVHLSIYTHTRHSLSLWTSVRVWRQTSIYIGETFPDCCVGGSQTRKLENEKIETHQWKLHSPLHSLGFILRRCRSLLFGQGQITELQFIYIFLAAGSLFYSCRCPRSPMNTNAWGGFTTRDVLLIHSCELLRGWNSLNLQRWAAAQ